MTDKAAVAVLDKLLDEQRQENERAFGKPCSAARAKEQFDFLKRWARGKPVTKVDDSSTFWRAGRQMTMIPPQEVAGMIRHGFANFDGDVLTFLK